jgi:hypothetical protein
VRLSNVKGKAYLRLGGLMPQERLELLCKQASIEHNPQKLIELMSEINDLIGKKRRAEEMYGPISRAAAA